MIFGVSATKDAVVIAQAAGSGETFAIKSITSPGVVIRQKPSRNWLRPTAACLS